MVGWSSEVILHDNVSCREHRVSSSVGKTCIVSEQLFYGYIVVSVVLDAVVVGRIVENSFRTKDFVAHPDFLHLHQSHDTYGSDEFGNRCESHHHIGLHLDSFFFISITKSSCIEEGIVAGNDELRSIDFPSFQITCHKRVKLLVFLPV